MPAADHRLTTREMAQFVANGYLRFDAIVPPEINEAVLGELPAIEAAKLAAFGIGERSDSIALPHTLDPLSRCYVDRPGLGAYLRLPQIQGIISSLVGDDPIFDHDFVHHLPAGHANRQHLHADAISDTATPDFDIQLFYFPHEIAPGAGGTRFVPGSHLRRVPSSSTARYQQLVGEEFYAGPAGTVMVFHHGLWHAGQDNPSGQDRWMYKLRVGPDRPQQRLWNLADFEAMHNDASDHIFANSRTDSVAAILRSTPTWMGTDESRRELTERARLWRYLSDDDTFDVDYYLVRTERRAPGA
ncbi:MAG: phytanoyl-CoA dioxygenase family protein [Acidimicrobiales bacterium]